MTNGHANRHDCKKEQRLKSTNAKQREAAAIKAAKRARGGAK